MKKVVIVHGWGGHLRSDWYGWLKKELELKGFSVTFPQLPDTNSPRIEKWVSALSSVVGIPDEDTYFVGHSLGCQTVARFLQTLPEGVTVGGVIFVAGFFDSLFHDEYDKDDMKTSGLWLNAPIDLNKVKSHIEKSVAYFSEDDPDVPLNNKDRFEKELGSEVIVLNGYKHFNKGKLPIVLEKLVGDITQALKKHPAAFPTPLLTSSLKGEGLLPLRATISDLINS